ncbi:PLP-dependent aminotransferase family protein [Geothrix sp. 21YS21S-4]|uniref:aminotransferase-like domain-containing protein n=1 Tax=Geothrix sp. 21YS21S-4 TaxID=3068889 RepID=UPI0027BAE53A|nr:PLP-dependent aminotransferase family protein [Geothrix sp. 21YS21S-4]
MLLRLRETGKEPKGRQIVAQIRRLIQRGHLKAGERLPSTRRLAEQLGLHRGTVASAYQELWALGWLDLRPGVQPRVRLREALVESCREEGGAFPWTERLALPLRLRIPAAQRPLDAGTISFLDFSMDPRLMPVEPFARSLRAVVRREGTEALSYGDPQGQPGLRACLAQRLGQHGVRIRPEEVLITHGAQQALDLALRGLARPGDAVVVESPTYNQMLSLLELHGLRALAMPEGPRGVDLPALETLIQKERPVLLYLMPSFQNPTGRCLDQAARETLLALCEQQALPILEDGFTEEMKYFGRPILPMKSMDRTGLVLYAGTFSKVLFPGLRLGWLAGARPCVEALAAIRRTGELGPSPLLQDALEDFLRKGHYDQHLARLHRRFRRRMETAHAALRRELDPAHVSWEAPSGGYLLWLEVRGLPDGFDLEGRLRRFGVAVRGGDAFFPEPPKGRHFLRLSISNLDEEEIAEGVARLGRGLRALLAEAGS